MGQWLCHYGTKGQKWGVRHWQNEDGTFNEAGKARYFGKGGVGKALATAAAVGTAAVVANKMSRGKLGEAVKSGLSNAKNAVASKAGDIANNVANSRVGKAAGKLANKVSDSRFGQAAAGAANKIGELGSSAAQRVKSGLNTVKGSKLVKGATKKVNSMTRSLSRSKAGVAAKNTINTIKKNAIKANKISDRILGKAGDRVKNAAASALNEARNFKNGDLYSYSKKGGLKQYTRREYLAKNIKSGAKSIARSANKTYNNIKTATGKKLQKIGRKLSR